MPLADASDAPVQTCVDLRTVPEGRGARACCRCEQRPDFHRMELRRARGAGCREASLRPRFQVQAKHVASAAIDDLTNL